MPRKPSYDRDDLIRRALHLFWSKGWGGTSLKDLEAVLKLKPGSFYAAFGSKEALYALALDRYAQSGIETLHALSDEIGAFEALKQHPSRIISADTNGAKACMLAKTVLEVQGHNSILADRANTHLNAMEQLFENLFAAAQARGDIAQDHDPKALARRYQSDLMGLRVSAERARYDSQALANDIRSGLERLA